MWTCSEDTGKMGGSWNSFSKNPVFARHTLKWDAWDGRVSTAKTTVNIEDGGLSLATHYINLLAQAVCAVLDLSLPKCGHLTLCLQLDAPSEKKAQTGKDRQICWEGGNGEPRVLLSGRWLGLSKQSFEGRIRPMFMFSITYFPLFLSFSEPGYLDFSSFLEPSDSLAAHSS